jgi:hypothetical protein
MAELALGITDLVDAHFPGWVECVLLDAEGKRHVFVEKVPVVTSEDLSSGSSCPRTCSIRCRIDAEWTDAAGRVLVRVDTETPWGIRSTEDACLFVVLKSQLMAGD